MKKRVVIRYLVLGLIFTGLIGSLLILRSNLTGFAVYTQSVGDTERGPYWDKVYTGDGNYNLKIYNSITNYYNGIEYVPIVYGSCGSNCFRDWNGLIYRVSSDPDKAYIDLYDIDDNLISKFGFGITGDIGGTDYKYSTLNFTWTWSQEYNPTTDEYIFRAWNNRVNFNWTQEFHFYPNQSMKIKNIVTNNLGVNIQNTKFWYVQTVDAGEGIWFNGTKYTEDTYKTSYFDSLLPQVKFEYHYVFDYDDLLGNGFNITDFYLGGGDIIGVGGIRILAIGITKGNSVFPTGISVIVDPTVKIGGSGGGGDAYVGSGGDADKNFGTLELLKTGSVARTYIMFNISAIPENQNIDNATLCLYVNTKKTQLINASHVYVGFDESTLTWNNQPCGTSFDNSKACNLTAESSAQLDSSSEYTWKCWKVTEMVEKEYGSGNENISIVLYTPDSDINSFNSKEASDSSLRPYLNITYSLLDITPPNLTIESPLNQSYNTNSILVNISAEDENLDSVWWYNGTDNITYTEETYTFPQGSNTIIAYANDSLGNENSSSVTFFADSVVPSVSIISPQDGSTYGYNESLELNYSVSDTNLDGCWYNVDDSNNKTLTNCENTIFDVGRNGDYILSLFANDSVGNEAQDQASFSVQIGAPTCVLNSPIDTYLNSQDVTFSYTPTDIDLDSCELWGNFTGSFTLNQTDTSPASGSENTFSSTLPDGTYLWNIKCNDTQGNSAFNGNKTFYIDTILPNLSISEPQGAKTSRTVIAQWEVSDINLESCWYEVYRGASPEITNTSVNCTLNSTTFEVTVDADFTFNFYVNDSAGNENFSSLSFSVSTSTPSPPSPPSGGGSSGGGGGSSPRSSNKLEITKISSLIVDPGESKKMVLEVKNIGSRFLNDCKIKGEGENARWISSAEIKGLSIGEKYDFIFTLNIPETLKAGSYNIEVGLVCQEHSESINFTAEIIEKKLGINLVNIERESKDKIKVIYSLIELSDIDQEVEVEIVLFSYNNERLAETTEIKNIEASSKQDFEAILEIPSSLEGNFNLLINAISETSSGFLQEEVILGRSKLGGLAIFGGERTDTFISIILLAVFGIFAVFIARRILKLRKLKKSSKMQKLLNKKKIG